MQQKNIPITKKCTNLVSPIWLTHKQVYSYIQFEGKPLGTCLDGGILLESEVNMSQNPC
jgi:hypothetical protein